VFGEKNMGKIIKPFGRPIKRVLIEVDQDNNMRIEGLELGSVTLSAKMVRMNPIRAATILTQALSLILSQFSLAGEVSDGNKASEGPKSDGDGNNRTGA